MSARVLKDFVHASAPKEELFELSSLHASEVSPAGNALVVSLLLLAPYLVFSIFLEYNLALSSLLWLLSIHGGRSTS